MQRPNIGFIFLTSCLTLGMAFGQTGTTLRPGTLSNVGIDPERFQRVDTVIEQEIKDGKLPGAVLLVARNGFVVYRKAYGKAQLTPSPEPMTVDKIFDLASVTKPVATATALLLLVERGQIRLIDPVTKYIPEFTPFISAEGDTAEIPCIYHLLTHTSGLPDYAKASDLKAKYGSPCPDRVVQTIATIPKKSAPGEKFKYSCLGYITLAEIIHRVTGETIDVFTQKNIFEPLGMRDTRYCPPPEWLPRIAPTEPFEGKLLRGTVHDPLAMLMDGKSGNAGLFSTADDLALFCQMLLNRGSYGKTQLLSPLTVQLMTTVYPQVAFAGRGLGWDINSAYSSNMGDLFPATAFGHTGFTGTSVVVDPNTQTIIILLTNAIHVRGGKVINLRSRIANIVAGSIIK